MDFTEAMGFLQDLTKFGFNFGLGRIQELLRRMGDPHLKLNVIHIGGTNGKGSTAAMISSILQAGGSRTGFFTSPHLHSYCERYRINGAEIGEGRIAELITRFKPHLEEMVAEGFEHPTEFEVSTALAFVYFYEEKVDFLVLEVGLGGAIDSTNVVMPLVSVITNVAMDHMDYLGNTVSEIAAVKSGIIKEGVPAITAADDPEALAVIRQAAREKGCELVEVGRDVRWEITSRSEAGQEFDLRTPNGVYRRLFIRLVGDHQALNAATAVAAVQALAKKGYGFGEHAIRQGLTQAVWPARLEMMQTSPRVLIDGAHNLHGAIALKSALSELYSYDRLILIFGMLGDKEREKVVAQLAPLAGAAVITRPNSPRAGDWEKIAEEVRKYVPEVYVTADISQAVRKGLSLAGPADLVCITGSLYMVAEAREFLIGQV